MTTAANSQSLSPTAFKTIAKFVYDNSAIVLDEGKEYLVETRLRPVLRRLGIADFDALADQLSSFTGIDAKQATVEALTTNETLFFRDTSFFDALREVILPEVVQQQTPKRSLTMWCAACSSGQEPYSVLMLLAQHFPQVLDWNLKFIVSDISREMQERTRAGLYTQHEVSRGLPTPMLVKYCEREGIEWRMKDQLRSKLDIREINLAGPWPTMPPLDIVFLRNVLIYFDTTTKQNILERASRLLSPNGLLFLGAAETTVNLETQLVRSPHPRSGCYHMATT